MMVRLFGVLAALAIFSPTAFAQAPSIAADLKDAKSTRVLVAAHRGAHGAEPENSLAAIERAIALGVDIIEIDVRLTRDGVPVLMHDASVDRTTDGAGAISELSFDQVRALHLVDGGDRPTGHRVPTLAEALATARGRVLVDLDLKTKDIDPIVSRVIEAGTLAETLFFNGDFVHLEKFRAIHPGVMPMPRAHSLDEVKTAAQAFAPEVIHIDPGFYDAETIKAALATDSRMWINALGEPDKLIGQGHVEEALKPLLVHGASVIQTDYPAEVIAWLESLGRH